MIRNVEKLRVEVTCGVLSKRGGRGRFAVGYGVTITVKKLGVVSMRHLNVFPATKLRVPLALYFVSSPEEIFKEQG
jgi:hypothetical protein